MQNEPDNDQRIDIIGVVTLALCCWLFVGLIALAVANLWAMLINTIG